MSDKSTFTWSDGSTTEAMFKVIDEGFIDQLGKQKRELVGVTVGSAVEVIELYAFKMCKNLEKVYVPDTVREINEFAFGWCDNLEEVRLPKEMNRIAISCFTSDANLRKIRIPDRVKTIDDSAFQNCTSLEEVILPDGLTWIGGNTFADCLSLKKIFIPASVEVIDGNAFIRCRGLEEVEFEMGSKLREIGPGAFMGCENMTMKLHDPLKNLQKIGGLSFGDCRSLAEFEIPETVTFIGDRAFAGCESLTSEIRIPAGLESLGEGAFLDCVSVTSAEIQERSNNTLPARVFQGCRSLVSVKGAECIENIGPFAFMGCRSLSEVSFSEHLTEILEWAFKGCVSLAVTIPDTIDHLSGDSLAYVKEITYPRGYTGVKGQVLQQGGVSSPTDLFFQFDYSDKLKINKEEMLRLAAYDTMCCLDCLEEKQSMPDDVCKNYRNRLKEFIDRSGNDNVTADLIWKFDAGYGKPDFPLSDDVEVFRDKLYLLCNEIRLTL